MAETTWTYVVRDFSSSLQYLGEDIQGSSSNGWRQSCPDGSADILGKSNVGVCDLSSAHITSYPGASVSVYFYGQSIQFFGNVTPGMSFRVNGPLDHGPPTGEILATVTDLTPGDNDVTIIADPKSPDSTLSFERAVITVGTGLTGATVTRSIIQDDDPSLTYTPASAWSSVTFDSRGIQHTPSNTTWHQLDQGSTGSINISFTGQAILVHGLFWSWFDSPYTVILDDQQPLELTGNPSIQATSLDVMCTDDLMFFQANLSDGPHTLIMEKQSVGVMALDYVEIIAVSGGSPVNGTGSGSPSGSPSTSNTNRPQLGVILESVLGAIVVLLLLVAFFIRRRNSRSKLHLKGFGLAVPLSTRSNRKERQTVSQGVKESGLPGLPAQGHQGVAKKIRAVQRLVVWDVRAIIRRLFGRLNEDLGALPSERH